MRSRHRVSKLLLRQGIVYRDGSAWTHVHLGWLHKQQFDVPGLQMAFDAEHDAVLSAEARRDRLDAAIELMPPIASSPRWSAGWGVCAGSPP